MRCKIGRGITIIGGGGGRGRVVASAALFLLGLSGGGGGECHDGQTAEENIALPLAFLGCRGDEV